MKKFIIIDGSSLMYRAFFALPLLTSSEGIYTNAIMGFSNMLGKILTDYKPDYIAVAFDKSRKTFRTDMYEEYKGQRAKTPDELKSQIPLLKEFLAALGIAFIEIDNYEADDIIGTLARKSADEDCEALIVTGDKDALQLIAPQIKVMLTKRGIMDMQVFDEEAFKEKYAGLEPHKLIDIKALMGDSSDNIPGVPGIGEKTALKLLTQFGDLENLLANIENVSGKKLKEKLEQNQDLARLSYKLATICCDVAVDFVPEKYKPAPDIMKLQLFCDKYELKTVFSRMKKILAAEFKTDLQPELTLDFESSALPDYQLLNAENIAEFKQAAQAEKEISLLVQTEGKVPHVSIKLMAASVGGRIGLIKEDFSLLDDVMAAEDIAKNVYDVKSCYHAGLNLRGKVNDVLLMAYLLEPAKRSYEMNVIRQIAAVEETMDYEQLKGEDVFVYDVQNLNEVSANLQAKLKDMQMDKLYQEIELPLAKMLADMENAGIYINEAKLDAMNVQMNDELHVLEQSIYELAGEIFNINSPKQLGEILFVKLGLPALKKTKTGFSTNAEVLENLIYAHPIIAKILDYRLLNKLKTTYLDGLKALINPDTKRIHTSFNQTVTETGRLSSSEPNLQNIPVRTAEGKKIRSLFEPGEGYDQILSADYSQIELRIMAHMSEDKHFLEAFRQNQDIHQATAAQVFHVPIEEVTPQMRSRAKAVNFGIIYGISAFGLAKNLHISPKEAGEYIDNYLKECSGVKNFMEKIVQEAHEKGYVTTLFGRRRYLPAIKSSNFTQRSLAERMAMNTPIQGTAADIIKIAMNRASEAIKAAGLKSRILLQVHDELVLEVVNEEIEQVSGILRCAMQNTIELKVPLTIDINYGENWAEAK
ncbi:DNA polymerase I [Megamonas hypermegale]|uniref:DNA polymerase I n=1 Tax=Megamonas hypermegale TaxID=158847 RepID=UPI0025A33B81|nr:DNA polymerase I [Megamonas hypermegale]MDM8144073.1 DNA polymerase I [Megamonas hypermegale]